MESNLPAIAVDESVPAQWRVSSLKIFTEALLRYEELLTPHRIPHNTQIAEEIRVVQVYKKLIRSWVNQNHDDIMIHTTMDGKGYMLLNSVLHKFWRYKEALLKEKEKYTTIEAALEGERGNVEKIREILQSPIWQRLERRQLLVGDFHNPPPPPSSTPSTSLQQQIYIGSIEGGNAFFGINQGQIEQSTNVELNEILKDLFDKLAKTPDIPDAARSNAIGAVQTIKVQTMTASPDKSILEKSLKTLEACANMAQIAQLGAIILPHLDKLKGFLGL